MSQLCTEAVPVQMKKETKIKAVMQDDLEEQEFEDILAADTNGQP